MSNSIIVSLLVALFVNELLGFTDWFAERITLCAARRWKEQTGFDHREEWLNDLEHSPGRLLKVFTASWMLLSTFVGTERLTLNLPSPLAPLTSIASRVGRCLHGGP